MADRAKEPSRQAVEYLNSLGKPPQQAKVLVVGLSCGGRCGHQSSCTVRSLRGTGALVDFYDRRIAEAACGGLRARGINKLTDRALGAYDVVIVQQPCSRQEFGRMAASSHRLLDLRPNPKDCII